MEDALQQELLLAHLDVGRQIGQREVGSIVALTQGGQLLAGLVRVPDRAERTTQQNRTTTRRNQASPIDRDCDHLWILHPSLPGPVEVSDSLRELRGVGGGHGVGAQVAVGGAGGAAAVRAAVGADVAGERHAVDQRGSS